ncbi:MAG: YybH family protein [Chthoniobacterales bacterium]
MKRLLLTCVMALAAAMSLSASAITDEDDILRLHRSLIDAWHMNDFATLNSIIADDFQFWSFKGERRNKADLLKLVARSQTSGDTRLHTEVEDPRVRVYGDSAILTCRIIDTGKHADGTTFTGKTADTHVFVRRGEKWVLVAEHETLLQPIK